MSARGDLEQVCAAYAIALDSVDVGGTRRTVPEQTLRALLTAMQVPCGSDVDLVRALQKREAASWRLLLPPVRVLIADSPQQRPCVEVSVAAWAAQRRLDWRLTLEDGVRHGGSFVPAELELLGERAFGSNSYRRYALPLPALEQIGYHRLEIEKPGDEPERVARMTLIVAPARCHEPQVLDGEGRIWGPAVQLYALRSARNWGIGDFTDLRRLVEFSAQAGAGIVGVNPLHALFPDDPEQASPYRPSSRLFLNMLYIDVEAVPEFQESDSIRSIARADAFQARLRALRASDLVDYAGVAAAKLHVLKACYGHFRSTHLPHATQRAGGFRKFQASHGEPLYRHALFEALQAHFRAADRGVWGWPVWPKAYRDPAAPAVAEFARRHEAEIEFHEYLQWLADEQLAAVGHRSWEQGLGVGVYQDLAVGVNPGGAEAWSRQDLYALGVHVGAPPDEVELSGQDWGLPPFIPHRLEEAAYAPFIATLRANMCHSGALRIEHVLGLMRLFWVPAGAPPADGAYVGYPLDDLLGILALESQRNQCLVIGEDLGTVPEGLRPALARIGVLAYRPLLFERAEDGSFQAPARFAEEALVCASSHDLPTLRGFWLGSDLDLRASLGLYPADALRERQVIERAQDRARLLMALQREGVLAPESSVHSVALPDMSPELALAVHRYLARSAAKVLVVQMEDVFGVAEQVNLPGSDSRHPNWRRKLPIEIEQWPSVQGALDLVAMLREERGLATTDKPAEAASAAPPVRIPLATYRLQFNRDFTFARAIEVLPYLHRLGISHCYASPYLKARPGSMHGYDIVDHVALNPEIGSEEDFEKFVATLSEHGMGQVLDIVPNHMGVMGSDNLWWLDVLENGAASVHADYFDIDWEPLKKELHGEVLLPLLGEHYGTVLSRGELKLAFDAARGEFSIFYYEHRLPVDPGAYPRILRSGSERGAAAECPDGPHWAEFQALLNAFGHLPARGELSAEKKTERSRDKEVHKRRLAELCARHADIAEFVEARVQTFNGVAGDPASFDEMHELIQAQAYRLAFWRVASDEINYRRFFDINDLAALRIEDEAVFAATHRRVFEWVKQGKVHGLRIDHPDGLYDPGQYFQRLQNAMAGTPAQESAKAPAAALSIYLVIEKILAEYERPPESWAVHGTTGYRFANVVGGLFVDTSAERRMTRIYEEFIGERLDFEHLAYRSKKLIMRAALAGELNVLANRLSRIAEASRYTCDFTLNSLRDALAEIVACFPVYRSYVTPAGATAEDRRYIDWAVAVAKKMSRAADVSVFDFVRDVLTTAAAEGKTQSYRDNVIRFAVKFQQFSSPVMAKGVEDTSFYIYNRLVSLNEVGGEPRTFGFTLPAFHGASQDRASRWPHTMLATSTHDSKRSEDVRVRISALSEMPAAWKLSLRRWSRINRGKKRPVEDRPAPSRNDEYLLYQTLVGSWPLEDLDREGLAAYSERIEQYMLKAAREAKVHTSWINPDAAYETALSEFIRAILLGAPEKNLFLADFAPAVRRLARFGLYSGLSQVLIKLTSPGVPDIYQGMELWNFSLVDPDNRRPVDYGLRQGLLDGLQSLTELPAQRRASEMQALIDTIENGRIKLYVTWKALQLRKLHAEVFQGGAYLPLAVKGARADHVCAFARTAGDVFVIVVATRFFARLLDDDSAKPLTQAPWDDTWVALPENIGGASLCDVLFDEAVEPRMFDGTAGLALGPLLRGWPVALLVSGDGVR